MTSGDLAAQLADSLARASREHAVAVAAGDNIAARSLAAVVHRLESLIADATQERHFGDDS